MQLVIATRQIPTIADIGHVVRRIPRPEVTGDGGAQVSGRSQRHNPDLDAIDIRRVLWMSEGRTAWLAPVFDVDAEDHIRILLAGRQGHLAQAGDGNGIGIGSPRLRSADPVSRVAHFTVRPHLCAVALEARAAQAVEDACCVETLQSAIARVTNMLPLTADVRTAQS